MNLSERSYLSEIAKKYQSQSQTTDGNNFDRYADDPIGFASDVLGVKLLTEDQRVILTSIRNNFQTNVPSAHSVGKTKAAALATLWWVFAVKGLCITTAPTERQVKELLWSEIRALYDASKAKLGGERGVLNVKLSETARAYGFASDKYDSNSFQGIHHERLLVIQDEACGISPAVDDGAVSCATGEKNRILRIGNPITPGTPFEVACKRSSVRIPAWSHPNVSWAYKVDTDGFRRLKPEVADLIKAEDGSILPQSAWDKSLPRDVIPGAISISWIEDTARPRGEGSAFWQSRIEAFFPSDNAESIIPYSWFLAARVRYDDNPSYWDREASSHHWRHGLDVGDGQDDHSLASWRGSVLYRCNTIPTKGDREDVTRAAGLAKRRLSECPGVCAVDRVGVGSGALAILLEQEYCAVGVAWGSSSTKSSEYMNLKSQQCWELREAFRTGEVAVAPLGDCEEELMEEFAAIGYDETSTGKIRIDDKTQVRKRLGRSPNAADSVVMGFHAKKIVRPRRVMPSVIYRTI